MKKIALTQRLFEWQSYREVQESLDVRWCSLLEKWGYLSVPLPVETKKIDRYLDEMSISGVVLTGGGDVSDFANGDSSLARKRDAFEHSLLACCLERSLPVLGVCRGMQFLAAHFGATFRKVEGHVGEFHEVATTDDYPVVGDRNQSGLRNSYHNYCIEKLPEQLVPIAYSQDGVVEAIVHRRFSNIAGMMWHPERVDEPSLSDQKLFEYLFQ